jgi:hypothetical protein
MGWLNGKAGVLGQLFMPRDAGEHDAKENARNERERASIA